jgi:hypothetical protein
MVKADKNILWKGSVRSVGEGVGEMEDIFKMLLLICTRIKGYLCHICRQGNTMF